MPTLTDGAPLTMVSITEEQQGPKKRTGIALHEILAECSLTPTAMKASRKSKVEESDIIGRDSQKMFGNNEAMSFLDRINSRFDNLETKTQSLQADTDALKAETQLLRADIDTLKTETQSLRVDIDTLAIDDCCYSLSGGASSLSVSTS